MLRHPRREWRRVSSPAPAACPPVPGSQGGGCGPGHERRRPAGSAQRSSASTLPRRRPAHRRRPPARPLLAAQNIDTDQIIPAEYLTLVPSKPDEYEKLGSYALIGLPDEEYATRYVDVDAMKTEYPVIIGGANFGCGSSREHAPVALGAAGATVVVAESYARIFFRNCVST